EDQPDNNQDNIAMSYQDNITMSYNDLIIELNRARELLEISQIDNQQRFQFLEDQKKEINELLQKVAIKFIEALVQNN
ncbi:45047_t:CDS:2, partial [Gigaspora margarita]